MRTALILGGTRFFGKRLVQELLDKGVGVTIANRGKTNDPFGEQVRRIIVDRTDESAMQQAFQDFQVDVIFDQICYSSEDARISCQVFAGKVSHYVFTSTLSVYDSSEERLVEEMFDPYTYPIRYEGREQVTYQEGKRQAEAVFFQKADFPVVAVRFPIVLGDDDYTKRLHFHIEHVANQQPIGMPNTGATISFIPSDEAARFLLWAAEEQLVGPYNAASLGDIKLHDLLSMIEEKTGKKAIIVNEASAEHSSPFGITQSWYMSTEKARETGFLFTSIQEWLPSLVERIANKN
ncbi:NAD-dependent epimerase/dehydratase family protein [Brevibacillus daliensis]|uniref:NAD-dependent epimerase/dehydratase family protein n=1 Tax=Brevibacillus daliensis TaxID=2892995 RepID=UPI001E4A7928|nr:NAD-dependent epimerase/dehydratase family protein [Brevibacillus daliensis]